MRKKIFFILILIGIIWFGMFYYNNLRGVAPAVTPAPAISVASKIPQLTVFATNVPNARVMRLDPSGNIVVSSPATGKVFRVDKTGAVTEVISKLNKPHGIAFGDGKLFIAETNAVSMYDYDGKAANRRKILDLPGGGNHFSRTIGFGPDGRLYVSIGSSCNVCVERDPRRASIWVANPDGSNFKPLATGLRNSVFFTWYKGEMWATDMGRDLLGDNIPPEELNIIKEGSNYGWPYCYGKRIPDSSFGGTKELCDKSEPPVIEYQAHSAPLGLAFYKGNLLVAMHGSWNRTEPTGYKVVRFTFDASGKNVGAEDFISGWLVGDSATGRPVDILVDEDEQIYISDDKAGVIYKVVN